MAKRRDRTPTTAHGLLAKTENLFEKLNEALKMTVKTDSYGVNFFEYISDVINKAAALPPNTPLEKYRMLLPDKWKENS